MMGLFMFGKHPFAWQGWNATHHALYDDVPDSAKCEGLSENRVPQNNQDDLLTINYN
jgi:hypothetical protein